MKLMLCMVAEGGAHRHHTLPCAAWSHTALRQNCALSLSLSHSAETAANFKYYASTKNCQPANLLQATPAQQLVVM